MTTSANAESLLTNYEAWQADHEEAMNCHDCEDMLELGNLLGRMLLRGVETWRGDVFRGVQTADEGNVRLPRLLRGWLARSNEVIGGEVVRLETRGYSVRGAGEMRAAVAKVEFLLSNWQTPKLSAAVGLRDMELDQPSADTLHEILSRPVPRLPDVPPVPVMTMEKFQTRPKAV